MSRVCPCGERLVQKAYESQAQFEERKYCDPKHKGKYHKDPPRQDSFGILVPTDKSQRRVGKGLLNYIFSRPV